IPGSRPEYQVWPPRREDPPLSLDSRQRLLRSSPSPDPATSPEMGWSRPCDVASRSIATLRRSQMCSTIVEIKGSHAVYVSQPHAVANLIAKERCQPKRRVLRHRAPRLAICKADRVMGDECAVAGNANQTTDDSFVLNCGCEGGLYS